MATVLIVEDEKSLRDTLKIFLEEAGHDVVTAADAETANEWVDRNSLDVALLDIVLPNASGLDVARHLRDRQPDVRSVLMTAEPTFASASEAIRLRIFDYVVKPFERQQVVDVVAAAAAAKVRENNYALLLREREEAAAHLEGQVKERTAELRRSAADLHALAARLQDVREEERTALARELHDEFGQNLTALHIDLEWVEQRLLADHPDAAVPLRDRIVAMVPIVERLTELTQRVCASLRPGVLDDLGLLAAIEWQVEEYAQRTGLECAVSLPADDVELDPDIALACFRILQEALTNVVRHADASRVDVRLQALGGRLQMEVQDDGRGFVPESMSGPKALGLLSMRERVGAFRGVVDLLSEPGKGTTVRVQVPLEVEKESRTA